MQMPEIPNGSAFFSRMKESVAAAAQNVSSELTNISGKVRSTLGVEKRTSATDNILTRFRDDHTRAFQQLSAAQFAQVWHTYDCDRNGYIEGDELSQFILDLVHSSDPNAQTKEISPEMLTKVHDEFMAKYDLNHDNKIEIRELTHLLPTDEAFLLIFRRDNPLDNSVEFMTIWKKWDANGNGFIDKAELKGFISDYLQASGRHADGQTLQEYTDGIMSIFDKNNDGHLQISEMAKLLPVKQSGFDALKPKSGDAPINKQIALKDIEAVFNHYDRDRDGNISGNELEALLKDLFELTHSDDRAYTTTDLQTFKDNILAVADSNRDGNIQRDELTVILLQLGIMKSQ